ncbi:MAG: response regulator [Aquabacterium sp.]|nr:response regulator [Aquabacterium sp.]
MNPRTSGSSLFAHIAMAAAVGLLVPALLIGGAWVGWRETEVARQEQQRTIDTKLDILASSLSVLLWNLDSDAADEVVRAVMQSPDVVRVSVVESASVKPFAEMAAPERRFGTVMQIERPIRRGGRVIGKVVLEVDDHVVKSQLARQRWLFVATVSLQLMLSLAAMLLLMNARLMRPLRRLGRFAADLAQGRFTVQAPPAGDDEIGQLGQAMDRMRSALQQQFESQGALIRRLRGLAETVPGAVYQLERTPDGRLRFRFVSEAVHDLLGVSAPAVMEDAQRAFGQVHEEEREALLASLERSARDSGPWQQEFRVRREAPAEGATAEERWLYANAIAQREPDGTVVWHGFLTDVSRQRRDATELERHRYHLEELVHARTAELARASEAAQTANRAKSAFLANMSHEIRTPLNAIVGLSYLARRDSHDPRQIDRLNKVGDAAQHLLSVVNHVLDLSKIEAGKLTLELADFSLAELMRGVHDMMAPRAAEKGLTFELDLPPELADRRLRGDRQRVAEVLLNYTGNAVKFTERGRIRLGVRRLDEGPCGLKLRFEVQDSGIGFDDDALPRLFREFEQADTSTTRRYGGTGLGLAISRRLAELMQGEVGASSTPGQGSLFWLELTLPVVDQAASPALFGTLGGPPPQFRGERVLLVEDNAVNQEVATAMLRSLGLQADVASNGQQALAMAADAPYALILMDIQMPLMDGLEATRILRQRGWRGPIVAMTANAFAEERARCLDAGMDDHLPKPVVATQLHATLSKWIRAASSDRAPLPAATSPDPV